MSSTPMISRTRRISTPYSSLPRQNDRNLSWLSLYLSEAIDCVVFVADMTGYSSYLLGFGLSGLGEKPGNIDDQRDPAVAQNGSARRAPQRLDSLPEAFDDDLLLPDDLVNQHAAARVVGFQNNEQPLADI